MTTATLLSPDLDNQKDDGAPRTRRTLPADLRLGTGEISVMPMPYFEVVFDSARLEPTDNPPYPYAISGIGTGALRYTAVFRAVDGEHVQPTLVAHFPDAKVIRAKISDGTFPALLPIHTDVRGTIPATRRSWLGRLFGRLPV